jgi:CheY-like chemotaxis protein
MDIQMPNLNGYEATKAIRALPDVSKSNITIIAMTANAFEEDKRDAKRAGMNGHLAKPVDVKQLYKTLMRIFAAE